MLRKISSEKKRVYGIKLFICFICWLGKDNINIEFIHHEQGQRLFSHNRTMVFFGPYFSLLFSELSGISVNEKKQDFYGYPISRIKN